MTREETLSGHPLNRRGFIKSTAGAGFFVAATGFKNMVSPSSPSHPVRIGFVGVGNRGMAMLKNALMFEGVDTPAVWSIITALTEESATNKSRPVDFPDYTRGAWKNRKQQEIEIE